MQFYELKSTLKFTPFVQKNQQMLPMINLLIMTDKLSESSK